MGGHEHHEPPYKIPDYRIYKVEDCPRLLKVQQKLAEKGLSDPWLRNEVWRFKESNSVFTNIRVLFTRGLGVGIGLLGVTLLYDHLTTSKDDGHGHGHH